MAAHHEVEVLQEAEVHRGGEVAASVRQEAAVLVHREVASVGVVLQEVEVVVSVAEAEVGAELYIAFFWTEDGIYNTWLEAFGRYPKDKKHARIYEWAGMTTNCFSTSATSLCASVLRYDDVRGMYHVEASG